MTQIQVSKSARRLLTLARQQGRVRRRNEAAFDVLVQHGLIDAEGRLTDLGRASRVVAHGDEEFIEAPDVVEGSATIVYDPGPNSGSTTPEPEVIDYDPEWPTAEPVQD
jgi:hypothetical protein